MKVKVYEYFGRRGIRTYTFLIGQDYISSIRIMGRKRVNLIKLFKKTKLEKRNPDDGGFLMPDKEYSFNLPLPYGRLGNTDLGICVER